MKPGSTVMVIGQQRSGTVVATFGGNVHVRFEIETDIGPLRASQWFPVTRLREVTNEG